MANNRETATFPRVRRIEAWALRAAIERPVETSFGIMRDRPAVFVRVEDADGGFGFGEIWCNFPGCGAEHRVRLAIEELGPILTGSTFRSPAEAFAALTDRVRVRVLQTGEVGPFRQAIAGLDIALWDLSARRAGEPVSRHLAPSAADRVPAYASGIHIAAAPELIAGARRRGFNTFKVKVGFELAADLHRLGEARALLADGERLLADANQAWNLSQAIAFAESAADVGLGWLEEPLPADTSEESWRRLAAATRIPLAAGENIAGDNDFRSAIAAGAFAFIQPDIAKWGGFSRCLPVARAILDGGRTYCPHYLGGGIGLVASAHLLAAAGGPGILEIDANPNPLRESFGVAPGKDGNVPVSDRPGLGVEAIPAELLRFVTLQQEHRA